MPKSTKIAKTITTPNDLSTRESTKKSLIKDLDTPLTNINSSEIMYSSEELANLIEEQVNNYFKQVYVITGNNCINNKIYREKIKNLHNRLIGSKNNFVIEALKTERLTVQDFCELRCNVRRT